MAILGNRVTDLTRIFCVRQPTKKHLPTLPTPIDLDGYKKPYKIWNFVWLNNNFEIQSFRFGLKNEEKRISALQKSKRFDEHENTSDVNFFHGIQVGKYFWTFYGVEGNLI